MSQKLSGVLPRPAGRKPLSKRMLLPVPRNRANEISLTVHLAFSACRGDHGNAHLMSELVRAVYLSYYLLQDDCDAELHGCYRQAERVLDQVLEKAAYSNVWRIAEEGVAALEEVIAIYDRQVMTVPTWKLLNASERLNRFALGKSRSPIPEY